MKCLSWWQPWATLIAIGAKRIETRSWRTDYRGPIAIHAAAKWSWDLFWQCLENPHREALAEFLPATRLSPTALPRPLPLGCIVATACLYDCWSVERLERAEANRTPELDARNAASMRFAGQSEEAIAEAMRPLLTPQERAFGDYSPGRFGWLLHDVRRLERPIPCRGAQGLFDVPDALLSTAEVARG